MRKVFWLGVVLAAVLASEVARAEWVDISRGLPEKDVTALAVHPRQADILYAVAGRDLYRAQGAGAEWKRVLSVRGGENQIRYVYPDPENISAVYVATNTGVRRSLDGGKSWKTLYRGVGAESKTVHWVGASPQQGKLWLGTGKGLVRLSLDGKEAVKEPLFPETNVYSVQSTPEGALFAATDQGIYKSVDQGGQWQRVKAEHERADASEETALSQFQIEELSSAAYFSDLVYAPAQNKIVAGSSHGLFEGGTEGRSWKPFSGSSLPDKKINRLTASSDAFYVATDRGAFRWEEATHSFRDISEGLGAKEVRAILYHASSGDLFAATKKGVFRYPKPEFKTADIYLEIKPGMREILGRFDAEPGILEVQQAAIRYAEVYPEKIEAWRQAAMRKALLPTVSLSADTGEDQNVDIDRGGTNDPDRFIMGPVETNTDWHAGISWDLGDLIWNDDQTSIDTRSKLMVELRDDVLNEVTHLYFERRRLQVEMTLSPAKELPLQIEKELKLQELTAGIDALTGGSFSRQLNSNKEL